MHVAEKVRRADEALPVRKVQDISSAPLDGFDDREFRPALAAGIAQRNNVAIFAADERSRFVPEVRQQQSAGLTVAAFLDLEDGLQVVVVKTAVKPALEGLKAAIVTP